ncbi:MAG: virulence factor SrfC family protein [Pseudomonadota bacterium]
MQLADACSEVAEVALEAISWMNDAANEKTVGTERSALTRECRRIAARARKLSAAAQRPMAVSVYGPSQAGKSFLVSVLARPKDGDLFSQFDDPNGRLKFISEINPEGEGESTGLVTRFTIHKTQTPPGYPVHLRLLSEADVARVLANTFLMDGDNSEAPPEPEEIKALVEKFRGRCAAQPTGGITGDEVWEIQEYFEKGFSKIAYVANLRGFWDPAAEIAPLLSISDRAQFLALLWGRHEAFAKLYANLAQALSTLGNPTEAFAPITAINDKSIDGDPRENSIVDVKALGGLDGAGDHGDPIKLRAPDGKEASLPRPYVTALTAEMIMPMDQKPWDIFDQTDLLDFPGARARFENSIERQLAEADSPLKNCFLRGKVAYLFDRYVAEQEITSMLLCIPPSNMEVTDLPHLITDWVAATHGNSAEERARATCLLFFVLTKFDMHLADSAGSSDDASTRFERRMEASLIDPFGKMPEAWPNNWADGRPFQNAYWLRNPNYPAEHIIKYIDGREIEILDHKVSRVTELKTGCLASSHVQRHFSDPGAAWDAAMALNDGGIDYLVQKMAPVCRREIKARQVGEQLNKIASVLEQSLRRFHVSGDIQERLAASREAADAAIDSIEAAFDERAFGQLVEELMVQPGDIAARIDSVPEGVRIVNTANGTNTERPRPGRPRPGRAAPERAEKPERNRGMTLEEFQADRALEVWSERMQEFAERDDLETMFHLGQRDVAHLVGELTAAARRLDLKKVICDELGQWRFADSVEARAGLASVVAAERINRFVGTLGTALAEESERPVVESDQGSRPVFSSEGIRFSAIDLPDQPRQSSERYLTDWSFALYAMYEGNAKATDSGTVDVEQNERLGSLIARVLTASGGNYAG